ncbi:MAG: heme ABC transporter permease CcmC, partial [Pseudomonadota bacterium]
AAKATAPIGAVFTLLALVTGSLWGKPMWGAWWAWDARLTSVLVLFFLYLGYMAIWSAIEEPTRAARVAAITCLVGFVNVPIIKFSVDWWNSLHQPASVMRADGPSIDPAMLTPLFLMAGAYTLFYAWLLLGNMNAELAERRLARLHREAAPVSTLKETPAAPAEESVSHE